MVLFPCLPDYSCRGHSPLKILAEDLFAPQCPGNGQKVLLITDVGPTVSAKGNVELAPGVDTPQIVVAGLVEVDEPACPLNGVKP